MLSRCWSSSLPKSSRLNRSYRAVNILSAREETLLYQAVPHLCRHIQSQLLQFFSFDFRFNPCNFILCTCYIFLKHFFFAIINFLLLFLFSCFFLWVRHLCRKGYPFTRCNPKTSFGIASRKVPFRKTHVLAKVYKCALPLKLQRFVLLKRQLCIFRHTHKSIFLILGIRIGCFLAFSKKNVLPQQYYCCIFSLHSLSV